MVRITGLFTLQGCPGMSTRLSRLIGKVNSMSRLVQVAGIRAVSRSRAEQSIAVI
jgi:hypothetical protein